MEREHFFEKEDKATGLRFCPDDGSEIIWWKQPRMLGEKPNPEEMKFYGQCNNDGNVHFFEEEDRDAGFDVCPVDKTEIDWYNAPRILTS